MSTAFDVVIAAMGLGRIALGLAPFVAAGPASRLLGFPAKHDNPTSRLMARLFGVRDVGLGVLAFYAIKHPEVAPFVFLFNAFMDLGDLFAVTIPLVKRHGIDRGAAMSGLFALIGGFSWLVVWLIAR
jgi:hypothetical protein